MATFNLPNEGDFPWDLNPAITAINSEVVATTGLVTNGRLSESNLATAFTSPVQVADSIASSIPVKYLSATTPGLDMSGATSSRAAIVQAISDTPNGFMLTLPANGRFLIDGGITASDRDVLIDLNGSTLIKGANSTLFNLTGGYDTDVAVSSYTTGTLTTDEESKSVTVLTLSAAAPANFLPGKVIKIVSDDVIPGGRPGSGGNEARLGEYHIIHEVSGTSVTLSGLIREAMTTNIRAGIFKSRQLIIKNGFIDVLDSGLGTWTTGIARISSFERPFIDNVRVLRSTGTCWNFVGCYGYVLNNSGVGYASDFSQSSIYGYGINDVSCAHGYVSGYYAAHVRHGFTDDSGRIATNSGLSGYGRSYGTVVASPRIHGSTNSAISTHSYSENQTFTNVDVTDSMNGVGLRGRKHIVRGIRLRNVKNVFKFFAEASSDSESWGHHISGVIADGVASTAITGVLNPTSGTRETRPVIVRDFRASNVGSGLADIRNATLQFEGEIFYEMAPSVPDGTAVIREENAVVESQGNIVLDTSLNTSGASQIIVWASSTSTSRFTSRGRMRLNNTADHGSRSVFWTAANTSSLLDVDVWIAFTMSSLNSTGMSGSSRYKYFVNSSGIQSEFLSLSAAALVQSAQTSRISRSREPVFVINTTQTTTGLTMFALPVGSILGQIIFIMNSGTTSFNIANGGNVSLFSGADTAIAANTSMRLMWNGSVWKQL